jgi:hypothetical protein
MSQPQRPLIDTATLLMGPTGSGKTSLIDTFARWLWKKYKKTTLLYSVDPGGVGAGIKALVPRGIVRVWKVGNRIEVPETLSLATMGYWPAEINPETGEASANVDLVSPVLETWTMYCPQGHVVAEARYHSLLGKTAKKCPKCGGMCQLSTPGVKVTSRSEVTPGFEDVGAVAYDGLTSMSEWIMEYQEKCGITGKNGVSAAGKVITSGGLKWGSADRPHYGFAQGRAIEWVKNSIKIPFLWAEPLFTCHEMKGDDEAQLSFYGPKLAGKALAGSFGGKIGNCLGTAAAKDEDGNTVWRLYVQPWSAEDNVPHACKNRAKARSVWAEVAPNGYLQDSPGEEFSKFNLGFFYDHLNAALDEEKRKALEEFADAPGLPTGVVGTGEKLQQAQLPEESGSEPETKTEAVEEAGKPTAKATVVSTAKKPTVVIGKKPTPVVPKTVSTAEATAAAQEVEASLAVADTSVPNLDNVQSTTNKPTVQEEGVQVSVQATSGKVEVAQLEQSGSKAEVRRDDGLRGQSSLQPPVRKVAPPVRPPARPPLSLPKK